MDPLEKAKQVLSKHGSPIRPQYCIEGKNGHTPFSRTEYLKRLFTFVGCPHFTVSRPTECSSVKAALYGFTLFDNENGGIECVSCRGRSYQPWREDMDKQAMASVYSEQFKTAHLGNCQWKVLPCLETIQYFDCNTDVHALLTNLKNSWGPNNSATELAVCGWKRCDIEGLAECALGCSKCVKSDDIDTLLSSHYYYCPWRWGTEEYPNAYSILKRSCQ